MKKILPILLMCFVFSTQAQHPQDFLKPVVWLRADQIDISTDYWNNVINPKLHAIPGDKTQLQDHGLINFNPAVSFSGSEGYMIPVDLSKSSQLTIIAVYHSKDTLNERGLWSAVINTGREIFQSTQRAGGPQSITKFAHGHIDIPVVNTTILYWGKAGTQPQDAAFNLGQIVLDSVNINPFVGDIAEFILFDRIISGQELIILESYLSLKYGAPLQYSDYVTAKGRVIWDYLAHQEYSYSVTGIGRDDDMFLFQKQSMNTEESGFLTIGAGTIASTNRENTTTFNKDNYLLWGMNDKDLLLERSDAEIYPYRFPVLNRKWLMLTHGNSITRTPTEIQLNVSEFIGESSECYLVMDRSGSGDFTDENIEFIPADHISETGIATFKNIFWNTKENPGEVFTFSFGMDNGVICSHPVCHNDATGIVHIEVMGSKAPYYFKLTSDSLEFSKEWTGESRFQKIENLPSGQYRLVVEGGDGSRASNKLVINNPEQFTIGLNAEYALKLGESLLLDGKKNLYGQEISFSWTSDEGFNSEEEQVSIMVPGEYTVTITTDLGCQVSETFRVKADQDFQYHMKLYPNPSQGDYTLEIILADKSAVKVSVYNSLGMLVNAYQQDAFTYHSFNGYLNESGLYFLSIETDFGKETLKLIITD